ncbi:hypothetical protein ACUH93_04375 [Dermabacteraceae bacterium P7006]
MDAPDVCVVSGGDDVRYRSYINHSIFAREHGFTFHLGIGLLENADSIYWYKFAVIQEVLSRYGWTLWLDDDAYVTRIEGHHLDIESLIKEAEASDSFLVISGSPSRSGDGDPWTKINTGVMLFKNDPRSRELLESAKNLSIDYVRSQWLEAEDGIFTNGDQDAIWHVLKNDPDLFSGVMIVDCARMNSRDYLYKDSLEDAFIVHFCGAGDKILKMALFGRRFGLGQELVPTELLDKWSVRKRQVMSDAEIAKRSAVVKAKLLRKKVVRKIEFVKENKRWK